MFKKIIVALGDSPHTESALENACQLAVDFGSQVTGIYIEDADKIRAGFAASIQVPGVMGAMEPIYDTSLIDFARDELIKEEEKAVKYFNEWQKKFPELNLTLEKSSGVIWEEIISRENDADLVVMGKSLHGPDGDEWGPGYNLKKVAHHSILPILVSTKDHKVGKNLMACYDGKKASLKALQVAIDLARKFHSPLHILTVQDTIIDDLKWGKKVSEEAVRIARESELTEVIPIIQPWNLIGTILAEIKQLKIDFLLMGAYGDNPLKDLILGSTTDEVLKKTGCPTLLYR